MPRSTDNKSQPQPQRNQQEPLDHKLGIDDDDDELETEDEELAEYDYVEISMEEFNVDDLKDMEGEGPDA